MGGLWINIAGLLAACPTTVVYFFGDQPFWGGACARAGVGPPPISITALSVENLVSAFQFMRDPAVKETALAISRQLQKVRRVFLFCEVFCEISPFTCMLCAPCKVCVIVHTQGALLYGVHT